MTAISVSDDTKREWDKLKPEDMTHDEFASHALDCVRRDNGEVVDVDELVDRISEQVGPSIELHAYRGTRDALNKEVDQ